MMGDVYHLPILKFGLSGFMGGGAFLDNHVPLWNKHSVFWIIITVQQFNVQQKYV